MSYSDKISRNFEPYREEGETVISAFPAMTKNQILYMAPLGLLTIASSGIVAETSPFLAAVIGLVGAIPTFVFLFTNKNFTVIATDRRTVIGRSEFWSVTKVVSVVQVLPFELDFGEPSGFFHKSDVVGERIRIHWRVFKDVRAANNRNR